MLDTLIKLLPPKVLLIVVVISMCGLWAWAFGQIPVEGQHGFVLKETLANDVQRIVGSDIEALKKQSATTERKVDRIKVALDRILADYYSKRIKDATRQRCKLPVGETAERDRLWDQINSDLNLYRMYSGDERYQRPTCGEV